MGTLFYRGKKLNVLVEAENLTEKELQMVKNAVDIIGDAVNSSKFEYFVLNYSWKKIYYKWKWFKKIWLVDSGDNFRWNEGLSRKEIYDKIMSGAEKLDPKPDKKIDIYLKVDRRNKRNVIGYTYPNTKWQWIYARILRSYDEYDIAANLIHEWCHKIGFGHEYKYTPLRQYTVPYAIGNYISRL